jgi:hypothetical protein
MMKARGAFLGLSLLASSAAAHDHGAATGATTPAGAVLALDVYAQGPTVDLLLAVAGGDGTELRHQRSRDAGRTWGAATPVPTAHAGIKKPRRNSDPQIVAVGDQVIVVWTAPGTSRWGGGPLASALSGDGGRTFAPGPNPADDGSTLDHNFTDLAAEPSGVVHAAWLDARDGTQGLRASRTRDQGRTWEKNVTIDAKSCECCWNRVAAFEPGQGLVLYRDVPRDMAVAVSRDSGATWARAATVGAFGWEIEGCPDVGGGLAATEGPGGRALHALVFTGREGAQGIHFLSSGDAGATWSDPRRVTPDKSWRPDLAGQGSRLAAAWDGVRDGALAVSASVSPDGGATWPAAEVLSGPGVSAIFPRVVAAGDRFLVFWTETPPGALSAWRMRALGEPSAASPSR